MARTRQTAVDDSQWVKYREARFALVGGDERQRVEKVRLAALAATKRGTKVAGWD
jgi:hypothetical protein